ncbi:MAG TPA: hypothetical protein PK198_23920, partial [Saprospiraceae bacterium]|nr:hypothetical protein [Saprospiraceae bacterium]
EAGGRLPEVLYLRIRDGTWMPLFLSYPTHTPTCPLEYSQNTAIFVKKQPVMLKNLLLLLLAATGARLMAQTWPNCDLPPASYLLNGNNVTALIQNNGMLFNSTDTAAGFRVYLPSADAETHTLRRASIWIGGLDPVGNMFLATGGDHGDSSVMRFKPGKINVATQTPYPGSCENFNNIWRVERDAIQRHIFDFLDNGVIDHPEPSLMAWPGRGNPHFEAYNGFPFPSDTPPAMMAPFWDADGDRMYNPLRGDYPGPTHQNRMKKS